MGKPAPGFDLKVGNGVNMLSSVVVSTKFGTSSHSAVSMWPLPMRS